MREPVLSRIRLTFGLTLITASAAVMLWLLWRYPLETALAAIALVGLLGVLARLAKCGDAEALTGVSTGD
jgi:hypothetical protein